MPDGDGLVGYAAQYFSENVAKVTAHWRSSAAQPIVYPSTMAIGTTLNITLSRALHCELTPYAIYFRFIRPGPIFAMPAWYLNSSTWNLLPDTDYRTEMYVEGKFCRIMLYKVYDGSLVGSEYIYDPDMQTYVGSMAFWEMLDSKLEYSLATAEKLPVGGFGGWPTLDIRKETSFASTVDGFVGGYYGAGGSVSWSAGTLVVNTTGAYGTGGMLPIGSVTAGDTIWVCFDVVAGASPNQLVTLAPSSVGGPIAGIHPIIVDGNGRFQTTMTVSTTDANANFTIAGDGTTTSITIDNLLIIRNPPTSL